jgi:hypothetical protein
MSTVQAMTTCPECGAPVQPTRRSHQATWLDKDGRGAGFSDTVERPASCSSAACDWEDRGGTTSR